MLHEISQKTNSNILGWVAQTGWLSFDAWFSWEMARGFRSSTSASTSTVASEHRRTSCGVVMSPQSAFEQSGSRMRYISKWLKQSKLCFPTLACIFSALRMAVGKKQLALQISLSGSMLVFTSTWTIRILTIWPCYHLPCHRVLMVLFVQLLLCWTLKCVLSKRTFAHYEVADWTGTIMIDTLSHWFGGTRKIHHCLQTQVLKV